MPLYVIWKDEEDPAWSLSVLRLPPEVAQYSRRVYRAPQLEAALEAIRDAHKGTPIRLKEYDHGEK